MTSGISNYTVRSFREGETPAGVDRSYISAAMKQLTQDIGGKYAEESNSHGHFVYVAMKDEQEFRVTCVDGSATFEWTKTTRPETEKVHASIFKSGYCLGW